MYLESTFKVEDIGHYPDSGRYVRLRCIVGIRRVHTLKDCDLDVVEGDRIRARIENHTFESGWKLDKLIS